MLVLEERMDSRHPSLVPLHEVREPEKVLRLMESMRKRGWVGRPLIGFVGAGGYINLLSGVHRLAAASAVLETIPVVILRAETDEEATALEDSDFTDRKEDVLKGLGLPRRIYALAR
jgi:ParB-like chromosome segregation protein Spo0J